MVMVGISLFNCILKSKLNFKKAYVNFKAYDKILELGLFDNDFYLNHYQGVKNSGMDPLVHYLFYGFDEGKFPSLEFDGRDYYNQYRDVASSKMNPLAHYALYGINEGKKTFYHPLIKRRRIISTNLLYLNDYHFEEKPLISIIILNRNGLIHLKRLFKNFEELTNYDNFEVIIVDNDSSDGSIDYLESLNVGFDLKIIKNNLNTSFSEGNNQAIHEANGEYVLLMNNDLEPTFGWLSEMVGTMLNNENVGAVGAKLIFPYYYDKESNFKSLTIQHTGVMFSEESRSQFLYGPFHLNIFSHDIFDKHVNKTKKVVAVTAACILTKKSIYEELEGLDESYFYGYEDVDFNLKLNKAGYDVYYCASALLFHHESSTRLEEGDYGIRALKNIKIFNKIWEEYLFKKILEDKLNKNFLFTNKRLKISFLKEDYDKFEDFISVLTSEFIDLRYNLEVINDLSYDVDEGSDIFVSMSLKHDINKIKARENIISVLILEDISQDNKNNLDSYDIIILLDKSLNIPDKNNVYYLDKNLKENYSKEIIDIISKHYIN